MPDSLNLQQLPFFEDMHLGPLGAFDILDQNYYNGTPGYQFGFGAAADYSQLPDTARVAFGGIFPRLKALNPPAILPTREDHLAQTTRVLEPRYPPDVSDLPHEPLPPQDRLYRMGATIPHRSQAKRRKLKMALPMTINGESVQATPDSGSEENIMSLDLANRHKLILDTDARYRKEFQMGNGKIIKAIGYTAVPICRFTKEPEVALACFFYVFEALITPMIMGMAFLQGTETLSRNRHRLEVLEPSLNKIIAKVCSLNDPKRRLLCFANAERVLANADTGSELDLISLAYARKRQFPIDDIEDELDRVVQFADGCCSNLAGQINLIVRFGNDDSPRLQVTFYVLEGLTCDLLLGEELLDEIQAFQTYEDDFLMAEGKSSAAELSTIVWFNTIQKTLSGLVPRRSRGMSSMTGLIYLTKANFS